MSIKLKNKNMGLVGNKSQLILALNDRHVALCTCKRSLRNEFHDIY